MNLRFPFQLHELILQNSPFLLFIFNCQSADSFCAHRAGVDFTLKSGRCQTIRLSLLHLYNLAGFVLNFVPMNKNLLVVGAAIAAALILGGGAYLYLNSRSSQPAPTTTSGQTSSNPNVMQSLRDLLTSGQTVKCTFSDTNTGGNVTGTTYIASGKVRADTMMQSGSQTINSHMIVEGNTGYMWMDGQTQGFKMSLDTATQEQTGTNPQTQNFDANKKMNYNCGPWVSDSSMFSLPAGVQFISQETMMTPKTPTTGGSSSQCSSCDNLPEPGKSQCRAALYCN